MLVTSPQAVTQHHRPTRSGHSGLKGIRKGQCVASNEILKQKLCPLNTCTVSSGSSNSFDHELPAPFKPSSSLLRLHTLPVDTDRVLLEFRSGRCVHDPVWKSSAHNTVRQSQPQTHAQWTNTLPDQEGKVGPAAI